MKRIGRIAASTLLLLLALLAVGGKAGLSRGGPYLEALPPYAFCDEAEAALAADRVADALELAEAGSCAPAYERARLRWESLSAVATRCWEGVWTGYGEGDAGVACAVASDLVVFGDVRDLTRQGLAWGRGEETDTVLVALSTAGVALTLAPGVGAGTSLLKAARRAGTLTRGLTDTVTRLVRQRSWRPLAALLGDAGRVSATLGPARGARALAFADTPSDLAALARFVETAPSPLLALRWGGKGVARIDDDALHLAALARGPRGVTLAAERGAAAMLSRTPLSITVAKSLAKHPDAVTAWALAFAAFVLTGLTWPLVLAVSGSFALLALVTFPYRRRRPPSPRRSWARGATR